MNTHWQTAFGGVALAAVLAAAAPAFAQQNMQGGQPGMQGGSSIQSGSSTQRGMQQGDMQQGGVQQPGIRQDSDISRGRRLSTGSDTTPLGGNDMSAWDTDQSGTLDFNEWNTGFSQGSAWDTDGDGVISDREYGQGIFNTYDTNQDQFWDDNERQTFQDDAGEGGWLNQ